MAVKFTKMHGLGNDFVMFNAVREPIDLTPELARKIADRHTGIGCDQLLIIERPTEQGIDFNYRIINYDGSEVGQCGNGARCLARFVHEQGLTDKDELTVKTITTKLQLKLNEIDSVTVNMGMPEFEPAAIPFIADDQQSEYLIEVGGQDVTASVLALGNPHCVQFVDDIDSAPVNIQGPLIESHERFPNRTNACYAELVNENYIKARVFERGVGETMACGSGACAIMVAARMKNKVEQTVILELLGGKLGISWQGAGHVVELTGPAVTVFESELDLENL